MKTKFFKIVMPVMAVALATGGAFASSASQEASAHLVDRNGYIKVSDAVCTRTNILCSTVQHAQMCSNGTQTLYDWNGTSCPNALFYRP